MSIGNKQRMLNCCLRIDRKRPMQSAGTLVIVWPDFLCKLKKYLALK